ncbi:YhdP family protein [Teredinibacter sp. KSP-S5-2]|uniref:YhdP family protein n=1 Tax=Teredinibacter sp. KSP-S5-2 TaxID=3034506 RepID=UPI002934C201|nr:YhdP family protein [Teredinibacter sp. KSP-S5-2]WNO09578.1 YhdP family protein [Teredinibacter sp. KSP-S5-2]
MKKIVASVLPKVQSVPVRTVVRRFWATVFACVIAAAVTVQLGRQAFPLLNDYKDVIAHSFGKRFNVNASLGGISATWKGLRPKLELHDLAVLTPEGESVFSVGHVVVELSIIDTLSRWRLAWRDIEFYDLNVALEQRETGRWGVKGFVFEPKKNQEFLLKRPLDIFLIGRHVEVENALLNVRFKTGHQTEILVPTILLENEKDFHRIQAYAAVDTDEKALSMIVEGQGDPRDPTSFKPNGYISLKDFPLERVTAAVGGKWWQELDKQRWRDGSRLNLEAWFRGTPESGVTIRGDFATDGIPLSFPVDLALPSSVSSQFTGKWKFGEGWQVTLQQMQVAWENFSAPEGNFKLYGNAEKPFGITTDALIIEDWADLLAKLDLAGIAGQLSKSESVESDVRRVFTELTPRGRLKNVDFQVRSKDDGYFKLGAYVENGQSGVYMGVPGFEGVNGYVELTAKGGFINVESHHGFSVNLPKVFPEKLSYDRAEGQVAWQVDFAKKIARVNSGLLEVSNKDELGKGYLSLYLPFNSEIGEPTMTLSVGVEHSLTKYHRKYVPLLIPKHLYDWLGTSIGQGSVSNVGFIYDGSIDKNPSSDPTIQLVGEVHNGNLAFDENWPELKNVSGTLFLDNENLQVNIDQAVLLGNRLNDARVVLVDNPHDQGQALSIQGALVSNAGAAMELLKNSPVRDAIGSTFDSWVFDGDVSAEIQLFVPLDSNAKGLSQEVHVTFNDAHLNMVDLELQIDKINGDLTYSSVHGMTSEHLAGKVWGRDVTAHMVSPLAEKVDQAQYNDPARDIEIRFSGPVSVANVREWTERPELYFAEGETEISGVLTIPFEGSQEYSARMIMVSDLKGVELALPTPLKKNADEARPLDIDIKIFEDKESFDFLYENTMRLIVESGDNREEAVQLAMEVEPKAMEPGVFNVHGKVPGFDLEEWNEVKNKYFEYETMQAQQLGIALPDETIPVHISLDITSCSVGGIETQRLFATGIGTDEKWDLNFESPVIKGDVTIYAGDVPTEMRLEYLRLPDEEEPEQEGVAPASALADVDLKKAISLDFETQEFSLGNENYGEWKFKLRPTETGIIAYDIYANVRKMYVGDLNEGAEFIWLQEEGQNSSHFSGNIRAENVADVLQAWGIEKVMESETANLFIEAQWAGAPDQVTLASADGSVVLGINNGNFIRGAEVGENPLLRLMGLLNFDTIARRLKLDFSDLAKRGFAFDSVEGNLIFNDGMLSLPDPMVVKSSSSTMQMAGNIDLIEEKLDTELVVTLPVASNLAVATAFVAGLPAAIGVYLVGKLLKKQVDRVSSISYQVTGDWVDPKIKVKRVFDNRGAQIKAEESMAERDEAEHESLQETSKNAAE